MSNWPKDWDECPQCGALSIYIPEDQCVNCDDFQAPDN